MELKCTLIKASCLSVLFRCVVEAGSRLLLYYLCLEAIVKRETMGKMAEAESKW